MSFAVSAALWLIFFRLGNTTVAIYQFKSIVGLLVEPLTIEMATLTIDLLLSSLYIVRDFLPLYIP